MEPHVGIEVDARERTLGVAPGGVAPGGVGQGGQ